MKISTEIASAAKIIGEEKAIELYAKAGFDAWDFSMFAMCRYDWANKCLKENSHPLAGQDYLAFARRLRKIGEENGIHCNQSHAPFPAYCKEIRDHFKRAIECTAEAGGSICIIHPDNYKSPEENAEMYADLLPFAQAHGVKLAAENMWNWNDKENCAAPAACSSPENFCAHIDALKDDFMVACLDIGHAEMKGVDTSAPEMIRALGHRLQALHIHDNDKLHDSHQIPFSMDIDFSAVAKALKDIGYKGYLTLEADTYLNGRTEETVFEGMVNLANAAKRLAELMK